MQGFVIDHDIQNAVFYRLGVSIGRDLLKALWDCSIVQDGQRQFTSTWKAYFQKLGMPDAASKSQQVDEMFCRFKSVGALNFKHLMMYESLLFVHGQVPFSEYSAKWQEVSGHGPPEGDFGAEHLTNVLNHFHDKLSHSPEKCYQDFCSRFNAFQAVYQAAMQAPPPSTQSNTGQQAPVVARPAKRPRTAEDPVVAAAQDGLTFMQTSIQQLLQKVFFYLPVYTRQATVQHVSD